MASSRSSAALSPQRGDGAKPASPLGELSLLDAIASARREAEANHPKDAYGRWAWLASTWQTTKRVVDGVTIGVARSTVSGGVFAASATVHGSVVAADATVRGSVAAASAVGDGVRTVGAFMRVW